MPEDPSRQAWTEPAEDTPAAPLHAGSDLGRRVAARRALLGLSREEVAGRSGSAVGYLQYVEEHAATPGTGFLLRLADALDTTVDELTGATADLPPGIGRASRAARLAELSPEECRELLGTHGVGRVAVTSAHGPLVLPVNYVTADGDLAFRTRPDAAPAQAAGREVAFEADHVDEALSSGWSVLAVGTAREVTDPAAVRVLQERAVTMPWAGGERSLWLALTPERLTGRRILIDDSRS